MNLKGGELHMQGKATTFFFFLSNNIQFKTFKQAINNINTIIKESKFRKNTPSFIKVYQIT